MTETVLYSLFDVSAKLWEATRRKTIRSASVPAGYFANK